MRQLLCLNGPNLDRLGTRQPEVYGATTLAELHTLVMSWGTKMGLEVTCHQSNSEAELVAAIHDSSRYDGVIFNPGAFTHYSHALGDAIASVETPVVEVHISNVLSRDRWRRRSVISPKAAFTIFGRGLIGYRDGMRHLVNRSRWPVETERYGPHPDQVIDFRHNSGSGPNAVFLHGGFYLDAWGRDSMETWSIDLARRGWSSAVIEYRRLDSGGGTLATTTDVAEAFEKAQHRLGDGPTVVIGHSAGAHLAVWDQLQRPQPLAPIVAVSGFFDLRSGSALGDGAVGRFDPECSLDLMSAEAPGTDVVLVHGSQDTLVPATQSSVYHGKLTESGTASSLEIVGGAGHFDLLAVDSAGWQTIRSHLDRLTADRPT